MALLRRNARLTHNPKYSCSSVIWTPVIWTTVGQLLDSLFHPGDPVTVRITGGKLRDNPYWRPGVGAAGRPASLYVLGSKDVSC